MGMGMEIENKTNMNMNTGLACYHHDLNLDCYADAAKASRTTSKSQAPSHKIIKLMHAWL